ncbi:protein BANP-like [Centruroides sculpturatus]|uniref:protein BANP-like n=1 Tax=Centruroides sculpturatus TaxID=218467 RepID=UPI000C6D0EC5|nr:protein BANP-like [Centruroides sculpturatus]
MTSFHQKDLSILQETEMRYEADALLDHQDVINDGSGQNDIQGMEASSRWMDELSPHQSIQRLLLNFNQVVCERLDAIERRLDSINEFCQTLEEKVEMLSSLMKESNNRPFLRYLS